MNCNDLYMRQKGADARVCIVYLINNKVVVIRAPLQGLSATL